MKKNKLNLLIDAILIILVGLLAGGGYLVYYVLIPGQECKEKYGPFTELHFWGMDRHEWANIHLIISFIFLAFTLLHIILHWKMIVIMTNKLFKKRNKHKIAIWSIVLITILIMLLPFTIKPELSDCAPRHYNYNRYWKQGTQTEQNKKNTYTQFKTKSDNQYATQKEQPAKPVKRTDQHNYKNELEEQIRGSLSLIYACRLLQIDANKLCEKLGIPANEKNERLGRIKRKYNLDMQHIKNEMIDMHLSKKQ